MAGFVSITPPDGGTYAIDKHFRRDARDPSRTDGLRVLPGTANYLFCELPGNGPTTNNADGTMPGAQSLPARPRSVLPETRTSHVSYSVVCVKDAISYGSP